MAKRRIIPNSNGTWRSGRVFLSGCIALAVVLLAASLAGAATPVQELDKGPDGSPIVRFAVPDERQPAPAISFVDQNGKTGSLSDFRGKITAVHFWATWCTPCRAELPSVDALNATLAGADFVILPLSVDRDGPEAVAAFYQANGIKSLPVFIDQGLKAFRAFKLGGIPSTIFIDAEGREIARVLGDRDWSDPDVVEVVRKLIAGG